MFWRNREMTPPEVTPVERRAITAASPVHVCFSNLKIHKFGIFFTASLDMKWKLWYNY